MRVEFSITEDLKRDFNQLNAFFTKIFYLVDHIANYKMPSKVCIPFKLLNTSKIKALGESKRRKIDAKLLRENQEEM